MEIDFSNMSASELDAIIKKASEFRAKADAPFPNEPSKTGTAIGNPAWFTGDIPNSNGHIALHLKHPGFGWLTFALPPQEAASLMKYWLDILSLEIKSKNSNSPSSGTGNISGNGAIH